MDLEQQEAYEDYRASLPKEHECPYCGSLLMTPFCPTCLLMDSTPILTSCEANIPGIVPSEENWA